MIMITTKSTPLVASIIFIIVKCSIRCEGFYSPLSSSVTTSSRWTIRSRSINNNNNNNYNEHEDDAQYLSSRTYAASQSRTTTSLAMGLFDFVKENFLDSRSDDFVRLEKSNDEIFGPGPLILMYAVPSSMDNEELMDMAKDGMPSRSGSNGGIVIRRLAGTLEDDDNIYGGDSDNADDALLDLTVEEALNMAMKSTPQQQKPVIAVTSPPTIAKEEGPCPVLYFSGVTNTEMMETYNIISNEIYEETNGVHWPACAKAVPPAMTKSLRRVLGEISGDHADAMRLRREEAEKMKEEEGGNAE
eukprot:CAMPEP_0196135462 /NCGR_PEP_ID=MMETSP0910-20130528/4094_1 /TAXON_ID=49265 /ORGANISM="Thalassiosira rotula, Strain GSO102" /LENGTH=301 /DNA_ID=CAMNT_0041395607 /DNA_START=123 /DNA_END=1028 /DNA_ORIENTATION=+